MSVADAVFLAFAQQRRFATAGKRDSIFDPYGATIRLIENCAAGLFADSKNKFLAFFSIGARLEDDVDRHTRRRHLFGRQYAVAVDGIVRTKIVILKDQPRTRHRNVDIW